MKINLSGHTAYYTQYHIVWITKYRRRILNPGVCEYSLKLFPKIIKNIPGVKIEECNIQIDHIHMLVSIPPKYKVSDTVAQLKARTSGLLRKKFDWLAKVYWKEDIVWSPGYFVSTVGINEQQIRKYIKYQQKQDSGQAQLVLR
jgi:putative transposase